MEARAHNKNHVKAVVLGVAIAVAATSVLVMGVNVMSEGPSARAAGPVMLILRGIADAEHPRGQLDDESALEYARRLGYQGEVLDVAANTSAQLSMALDRIRHDEDVTAIYGFSGGGYNARRIWSQLNAEERQRIDTIIVVGSPGVEADDFPGSADVLIKRDPPAGHMAGPKALLESLDPG
jgi:hypothetical protein